MEPREDPAEHDGSFLRFYYRDWRPTLLGRIWTRIYAWLAGWGLFSDVIVSLLTNDQLSGRLVAHVLVPTTFEGQRYFVSMLGERSNWVQDVRAANGAAFIKHGRSRPVVLTEVPPDRRAPILKAWCRVATSGRRHLPISYDSPVAAFEAIARDYPVFRIDSTP
jgi:hypothetical protein